MPRPDGRGPPTSQGPRINQQIRIRQIRVIDDDGSQLGVLETADALALAIQKGLDLVEIAPTQRPPVCRIMDFGKYKYEVKKKEQASRKKQHQQQLKELRVSQRIGAHDLAVRVKQARDFFVEGDKVEVVCRMRGREQSHPEIAVKVMMNVVEQLKDVCKIERPPRVEGNRMVMLLTPR
jgi:translation initiation factor IF-3